MLSGENRPQLLAAFIATLNALPCGMQYGWSAPTFPLLRSNSTPVEITPTDETWLESSYTLAGLAALPCTTYLVDKIGRKYSILLSTAVTLLSWLLLGVARRTELLYLARVLSGMASDTAFVAIPMYVAEIAGQHLRGFLVGLNYLMMLLGVLVVYSVTPFTPYYATALVGGAIAGLQLALSPLMPRSPYHLLAKNRKEEAAVALGRLRGGRDSRRELEAIEEAVRRQNEDKGGLRDLLAGSSRRGVAIVAVLIFCQHFSGYSVMVMNLHSILSEAGGVDAEYAGIASSALMLAGATLTTLLVDRLGRRRLLVASGVATGVCLSAVAVYFSLKSRMEVKRVAWIPVASLTAYAVTFKLGLGFLPQVINSEVFPSRSKATGMTVGDAMFIVFSSASLVFYKYVAEAAGLDVPLYVFACVAFLSAVFSLLAVPETKGKTLDEIQGMMKGYGSVSPRTSWGKLVTIIYALVGIPLMLLYLSTTGDLLARSFRRLYGRVCGAAKPCPCGDPVRVPVTLCLAIVLAYICSGAVLFHRLEDWSLLEGSYFCFTSLGTIGFGDLVPGQNADEASLCACSAYILTGMALVAMCFSLVQEEVIALLRYIGAACSRSRTLKAKEEES